MKILTKPIKWGMRMLLSCIEVIALIVSGIFAAVVVGAQFMKDVFGDSKPGAEYTEEDE